MHHNHILHVIYSPPPPRQNILEFSNNETELIQEVLVTVQLRTIIIQSTFLNDKS